MRHAWSLEDVHLENAWLTIGMFDGVHLGHQEILERLTNGAQRAGCPAVVVTFFPHPAIILNKRKDPFYLTDPEKRASLIGEQGVDLVITHPFDLQVAQISAEEFITQLKEKVGFTHLLVGYDFALGHNREGDIPRLEKLGQALGFLVEVMPPQKAAEAIISSSQIRQALVNGDLEKANRMLGRPFSVHGEVIRGDSRGRSIGIPTANIAVWGEHALPKAGVYVCRARWQGEHWDAVTNIGMRPTFEHTPVAPRLEAHLLDFHGDLYGKDVEVEFLARLRDEQRFPGVEQLVEQIHKDIQTARQVLTTLKT